MQIDPGAYIAELLYKNDTVSLPGFGSFIKAYKNADIDYVQGEIKPPSSALSFNNNLVMDDGLLAKFLKKKHGLPLPKAEQIVQDYINELKQKVENKEFITFPGLGRLYRDFEGNFKFLPESTNFNTETYGLPDLHFYPVAKTQTIPETTAPVNYSASEKVSNRIADWFAKNLIVVLVAVGLVLFATVYIVFFKNKPQPDPLISEVDSERINVSPSDTAGDYEVVDDYYDDEDAPMADNSTPQPEESPEENDVPKLSPKEKTAVIIIGKFGKQSNVDRLVKKIYEAGYEPYTDKEGKLTVVGIQMIYEQDDEVHQTLSKVQNKFEPDAEILKMGPN